MTYRQKQFLRLLRWIIQNHGYLNTAMRIVRFII